MTDQPRPIGDDLDVLEVEQLFAHVPEWLLKAPIPDRAKTLYAVIQRFGNSSGHRMPGQAELGRWLHCSPDTIDRATRALEAYGALRVERSPAVRKGQSGVVRAPNRYFLRTTDPHIGHVIPAHRPTRKTAATPTRTTAATVAAPMRSNRRDLQPPPPTPSTRRLRPRKPTFREAAAEISTTDHEQLGDLRELAARCRTLRVAEGLPPTPWGDTHVARAVADAIAKGYPARKILDATVAIAVDPETKSPMRLGNDGPWWDVRDLERHAQARRAAEVARAAADREARGQAASDEARRRASCADCHGTGRRQTVVEIRGESRTVPVTCTHEETA